VEARSPGGRRAPVARGTAAFASRSGVVFGPRAGRNYRKAMPRKMRRLALRSALSSKASEGQLILVDSLEMAAPSTKEMSGLLNALTGQASALILLPDLDSPVERSVNNLPYAKTLHARYLNLVDIFGHDYLIMPLAAVKVIEEFLGR
jgi:large subunit ribosomal protein L4